MTFITRTSKVRTIRESDDDFKIVDGMVMYPRAMIHLMPDCPAHVRTTLNWAMTEGYVKMVAHVIDHELVWDKLSETAD